LSLNVLNDAKREDLFSVLTSLYVLQGFT